MPGLLTTHTCGRVVHALVRRRANRRQFFGTFFLRNRPQLELIRRLACRKPHAAALDVAVIGCSNGAEVYSMMAIVRSARPDLAIAIHAVDLSREALEIARSGVYSLEAPGLVDEPIFQRMTGDEIRAIFDRDGDCAAVKPWVREGIRWHLGDARDGETLRPLGRHDIVAANNVLCHMTPAEAERCLRVIATLVRPGGHLVVSGIDLEVRSRVARDSSWTAVTDLLDEIHEGDPAVRRDWPWKYWGLEPLDKRRRDWPLRYATVFQTRH